MKITNILLSLPQSESFISAEGAGRIGSCNLILNQGPISRSQEVSVPNFVTVSVLFPPHLILCVLLTSFQMELECTGVESKISGHPSCL